MTDLLYYAGGIACGAILTQILNWSAEEVLVLVAILMLLEVAHRIVGVVLT